MIQVTFKQPQESWYLSECKDDEMAVFGLGDG